MSSVIEFRKNREIFDFLYNKIDAAKISIKLAVAWFTDPELAKILLEKKNHNLDISVILFKDQINTQLSRIKSFGDALRFSNDLRTSYIMHHKFCIIDNETVITGSYNWTVSARRYNKENIICTNDKSIVNQFNTEFKSLYDNSSPQSGVHFESVRNEVENVENLYILNLEKDFNDEIYQKIDDTSKLKIKVDIGLAYDLVRKHTPVIASKKLAEVDNGDLIQSGLGKAAIAGRLDLSFEESILNKKYMDLFAPATRDFARKKLTKLDFFKNQKYASLWPRYN